MKNRVAFLVVATASIAACFLTTSCDGRKIPGLVPLRGEATYEGRPLAWASLSFSPTGSTEGMRVATAQTDENGRFTASTLGVEGATPGEFSVTVQKFILDEPNAVENWERARQSSDYKEPRPQGEVFDGVAAIPRKYADKKTSELTIVVGADGEKDAQINITK